MQQHRIHCIELLTKIDHNFHTKASIGHSNITPNTGNYLAKQPVETVSDAASEKATNLVITTRVANHPLCQGSDYRIKAQKGLSCKGKSLFRLTQRQKQHLTETRQDPSENSVEDTLIAKATIYVLLTSKAKTTGQSSSGSIDQLPTHSNLPRQE
jgi:hypothetical protein